MKYSKQYKSESELPKKRWVVHNAFFSKGVLTFSTHKPRPAETLHLLERFAGVFDLTYTRFLDLQKAEERAREAQIEAALERVRSRSMAMHHTTELQDVINTLHQQFKILSVAITGGAFIAINEENKNEITCWGAGGTTDYVERVHIPFLDKPIYTGLIKCIQKGSGLFTEEFSYEEKIEFFNYLFKNPPYINSSLKHKKEILSRQGGYTRSSYVSKHTCIFIINHHGRKFSEEENKILIRFGKVFEQSYTRFLDLKKAEAQTREAEIEAALERVRSRTMAMQKSDELAETASHFFEQLNGLGIKPYRFNIAVVNQASEECQLWSTSNEGKVIPLGPFIPLKEHKVFNQMYDGWRQQLNVNVIRLHGEERIAWTKYIMRYVSFNEYKAENIDLEKLRTEPAIFSNFFFRQGFIVVHTLEEINDTDINIIQRFVNVFEQTYTRFLDLQKAEAQAREAQIESSLERVRSKAMSMHSPNDLSETVNVFFRELKTLGIVPIRCGVGQMDEATRTTRLTTTTSSQQGDSFQVIGKVKQTGHPVMDGIFDHWKLQKEYHPVLEGEDIISYYSVMNPQIGYPEYSENVTQYGNIFPFKEGFVFAWTENKLSNEELQIFRRFTSVLSLTYRRYIDLKAAEVRAFEAVRQASLDRIRAEIASMRTSEDLNHITPIIWRELKNLEVPFFRCGVYIVNESSEMVQVYLTTPNGKSLGVLNLSFDSNEITNNTVNHWRNKIVYKTHWDKEEFIGWTESMMKLGQIKNAETYQGSITPPESLYLHFVPFEQGMLYVGDVQPLTVEKLQLVKILAEAFSIAYARYEDFRNLEEAKNKIEFTLTELKSAQAQLIHSEKMASLGELTAGIAHEIKNPLNFVNNFSEISRELLDEMKTEVENKNMNEVIELIEDLKQNLDKINQHGKRADSIVKGMLLHSRGTSGEKTPTDINDLLDQYVNLAYHGMRATNKEFNITIEKDYDESLGKINVVPQDISRVFLNIINNACYAAFDKKKKGENNFSPVLRVSTKKVNNRVEIKISDNGNGIPADHLDKIFQPFFTTKPTGEGTGLGLSLSYDIVTKVHNGKMRVETKVGEGTEFIIILNN